MDFAIPPPQQLTDRGTHVLLEWDEWLIEVAQYIGNARVMMTPIENVEVYDYGWCYPSVPIAVIAVAAWDPETEDEPPGWHKRSTRETRQAPQRDPAALVRCAHGVYPEGSCADVGCVHWRRPNGT